MISQRRKPAVRSAKPQRSGVFPQPPSRSPKSLPKVKATPQWYRNLQGLERSSWIATFFLVALTLGAYSWTVYTQQEWTKQYRRLQTLQRQERQMTATHEVLKNQFAQEAENPNTGLIPANPSHVIFIKPASARPPQPLPAAKPDAKPAPTTPLGY